MIAEWGSKGTANGEFRDPSDIAIAPSGDVLVADSRTGVQRFSADDEWLGRFGPPQNPDEQQNATWWITVSSAGSTYLGDIGNSRVEAYSPAGRLIPEFGSSGAVRILSVDGLATDSSDNVYAVDSFRHRVRKYSPQGQQLTSWPGGGARERGSGLLQGVAVAPDETVYVGDVGRIRRFTASGDPLAAWGSYGQRPGQLEFVQGLAVGPGRTVYATEANRVSVFSADGEYLASFGKRGSKPGQFRSPRGIATDAEGQVYVADPGNHRVQVFREIVTRAWVSRVQEFNRASATVGCPQEACSVTLSGEATVSTPDAGRHRVAFGLRRVRADLAAGERRDVSLRFDSSRRLERLIARSGTRARATIDVRATQPIRELRPTKLRIRRLEG